MVRLPCRVVGCSIALHTSKVKRFRMDTVEAIQGKMSPPQYVQCFWCEQFYGVYFIFNPKLG